MQPFTTHTGIAVPLIKDDINTDQIAPVQSMRSLKPDYKALLFMRARRRDDGSEDPDFVLNKPQYQGASILLARKNFGCGSSREHAPWALQQYGFKAVIAPSFAEIFYNNCFKNGLLAIMLSEAEVERLFHEVAAMPGYRLTIDLPAQTVAVMHFDIDPTRKENLINGLDEIGLTLRHADEIKAYEEKRKGAEPWIFK